MLAAITDEVRGPRAAPISVLGRDDGLTLARRLREESAIPIIMLTGRP
jgi:CheY-like chemotaxis protein